MAIISYKVLEGRPISYKVGVSYNVEQQQD